MRGGHADATVERELADGEVDHLRSHHPEVEHVRAAVDGSVDQRGGHRGRREPHVAPDRDPPRLEVLDVGAADRVRALFVQFGRIDAANVVGLEDAGIEHGLTLAEASGARRGDKCPRNYNYGVERKLATVLFVDLVGSTAFVTASDPEVVRRRVNSYFEHVSQCIATHGGIVEKFAGDAVMAAFGIPTAHEDDAERAVRAAVAILDSVHGLGLEARIGIEAGEVVADESDSTFATGEAVNVAARLQQIAEPGEILIGPFARRLTLSVVDTEERGFLELKGFDDPLPVWRLECIPENNGRVPSVAASFVGREHELELLHNTLARVVRDRRAHLFTIYGEPGVGKSRLAREFADGVEGATVLAGRSLSYGEGVTYWPLAEMVKIAAGITDDDPVHEAVAKLRACCGDDAVADLLALAVGVLEGIEAERSQQEIAWAAHEWAAELADAQPLILVFEDVHWAEDPLLELIEHLAERVKDAPLLIVCLARPELLDIRPGWGGGVCARPRSSSSRSRRKRARSSSMRCSQITSSRLSERAHAAGEDRGQPALRRGDDADAARGRYSSKRIPDTLQAIIAARIDRLPRNEKRLLQRASVIGRIFWEGAVAHLAPTSASSSRSSTACCSAISRRASTARRSRASRPTASSMS